MPGKGPALASKTVPVGLRHPKAWLTVARSDSMDSFEVQSSWM